jgi:hypothetical protein
MVKPQRPRLYKPIFLATYKPHLNYYSVFRSAAAKLSGYPDWTTDFTSITLQDFDHRCSLTIQHNSFGFSQDSDDVKNEEARLKEALDVLPQELKIKTFVRLGYRRQYLVPVDMSFEALVSIIGLKLLSHDQQLEQIIPGQTKDLLYRIDCVEGDYRYHLHLGPLRRAEIPRWIVFEADNHLAAAVRSDQLRQIVSGYPEVSTLIDIDMYRAADNISDAEAKTFIPHAQKKVDELALRFHEYLFSTEVK